VDREPLQIRSYRVCFDLEKRIYRLEQWRLPVAWGIPLRGVGYAALVLVAILIAAGLPLIGPALGALPAPVRLLIVPVGVAYALTAATVDGRPLHAAAGSLARHALAPTWVSGFECCHAPGSVVRLGDLTIAPDHSGPVLRHGRIEGPCRVLLRYPARGSQRRGRITVTQTSSEAMWRGKTLALNAGQTLELRS
jgi:hypothetical protein